MDISSGGPVVFYTSLATVQVNKHDGSAFPGAAISYKAGYDRGIGNTDGDGKATVELFPGTYTFKAAYGGTAATQDMDLSGDGVSSGGGATVVFYTSLATVQVNKHDGSALAGAAISYKAGYDRGIGNTDGDGKATVELFPGTYTFKAAYGGTTATQDFAVPGDGHTVGQTGAAPAFYTTQAQVLVKKHDGTALAGASASYKAGYYRGIGNTNGSGEVDGSCSATAATTSRLMLAALQPSLFHR